MARRQALREPGRTAYERALLRLSRRDHTEAELRRALRTRGHEEAEIEEALRRLRAQRYLDDASFAERFSGSRVLTHKLGRARIRRDLRQRGVTREVAEAGLRRALEDASEAEALDAVARRYWKQHERDEPALRVRRLWAFLLRRGFPSELVSGRLRRLWPRWSDALEGLEPVEVED
jgi:regulatory protein